MKADTSVTVGRIMSSKKYRFLYRPTVERILADVVKKYPSKRVEKEARRKLHQLWGAYFTRPTFEDLLERAVKQKEGGEDAQTVWV